MKMLFPETCFIDSNIFILSMTKETNIRLENFLNKVKYGEIKAYINAVVISEVFHKLLIAELRKNRNFSYEQSMELIKEQPEIISKLKKAFKAVDEIISFEGIEILEINKETVLEARKIAKENNMLFQDALIASNCKLNGVQEILTKDADFERVEFLNIIRFN